MISHALIALPVVMMASSLVSTVTSSLSQLTLRYRVIVLVIGRALPTWCARDWKGFTVVISSGIFFFCCRDDGLRPRCTCIDRDFFVRGRVDNVAGKKSAKVRVFEGALFIIVSAFILAKYKMKENIFVKIETRWIPL